MEESRVTYGSTTIEYAIQRGRRQKTVAVAVDPVDGVRVRAPQDTPIVKLDEIVHRKAQWIVDSRRRHEDVVPAPARREFVSGETFLYLGRQYRLKVRQTDRVRLVGGHLVVPRTDTRTALEGWYRDHAQQRLPRCAVDWGKKLGLEAAAVLIREQRKRWGSADAQGRVRLNWRIVQAPQRLVDYVVAHELVHLRHSDHTRDFWAELGSAMPDYEVRREELRRTGPLLIW